MFEYDLVLCDAFTVTYDYQSYGGNNSNPYSGPEPDFLHMMSDNIWIAEYRAWIFAYTV